MKQVFVKDIFQKVSWNIYKTPIISQENWGNDYQSLVNNGKFKNLMDIKIFLLVINIIDSKDNYKSC